jgi:putative phosphoesterase
MPILGILSDAHGNISAFRHAVRILKGLGAERFYFLGDALGYIPSVEIIQELMEMGTTVKCILGNHENMILDGKVSLKHDLIYQHERIKLLLNSSHRSFLKTWTTHLKESIDGIEIIFVHGSPNNYSNEYVYPNSDLSQFKVTEDFVFMGHSHHPFIRVDQGTTFINVGSCGLPRDDGRYGSCAIFDSQSAKAIIYRYEIDYVLLEPVQNQIDPKVLKVFKRRSLNLVGQIIKHKQENL